MVLLCFNFQESMLPFAKDTEKWNKFLFAISTTEKEILKCMSATTPEVWN